MKNFCFLIVIALISCKPTVERVLNNHIQPIANQNNKLKIGETIIFSYYEREGIDRSKYPAPTYSRIVDSNYFKKLKNQELNDGSDGGITNYFEIYEAIKSGETNIETFEILSTKVKTNDSIYFKKTKKKLETYSFTIK